jgi:hypothetical protein
MDVAASRRERLGCSDCYYRRESGQNARKSQNAKRADYSETTNDEHE